MTATILTTLIGIGATAVIALIGWTLKKVADNLSKDISEIKSRMGQIEVSLGNLREDHAHLEGKLDGVLIALSQDRSQQPNPATQTTPTQATATPALPTPAS